MTAISFCDDFMTRSGDPAVATFEIFFPSFPTLSQALLINFYIEVMSTFAQLDLLAPHVGAAAC
jgi:hypothetical protein